MAIEKLTENELLALGSEVTARWMGMMVSRGLIPLMCVCVRNVKPGSEGSAYEVLASKGVDEGMVKKIVEKVLANYKNAENIVLK